MKVLRVIVSGDYPKWCDDCAMCDHELKLCNVMRRGIINYLINGYENQVYYRPDWCPLVAVSDLAVSDDGYGWIVEDPDTPWKD